MNSKMPLGEQRPLSTAYFTQTGQTVYGKVHSRRVAARMLIFTPNH
jgi:hypothetical protein